MYPKPSATAASSRRDEGRIEYFHPSRKEDTPARRSILYKRDRRRGRQSRD